MKRSPEEIIHRLEAATHLIPIAVVDNLHIEATINDEKLVFYHRLDAFRTPSKQEAAALLAKLNAYYLELYQASEMFRRFLGARDFVAELYVFSGQMDFSVATMDHSGITWHVNLAD